MLSALEKFLPLLPRALWPAMCCLALTSVPTTATAEEHRLPLALGLPAAEDKSPQASGGVEVFLSEGLFSNQGTGSEQLDVIAGSALLAQGRFQLGTMLSLRLGTRGAYAWRTRSSSDDSSQRFEERKFQGHALAELAFNSDGDVEVFGGAQLVGEPTHQSRSILPIHTSTTTYKSYFLPAFRLGLLKRSGTDWVAGGYYTLSASKSQEYTRSGLEGQQEKGQKMHVWPARMGGFAQFGLWGTVRAGLDLALVFAGDSPEKNEDKSPIFRDYYTAQGTLQSPILGGWNCFMSLAHRTFSYNEQGTMGFETLPSTSLDIRLETDQPGKPRVYFGAGLTQAEDSQTTTELNAKFLLYAYAFRAGFHVPM